MDAVVEVVAKHREDAERRLFDLLEAITDGYPEGSAPWRIKGGYARGTNGYEHDFVVAEIRKLFDAAEREHELVELRQDGWSVAVHNDYKLNGEHFTFWLFTHPNGRYVKGEGRTDSEALSQCLTLAKH